MATFAITDITQLYKQFFPKNGISNFKKLLLYFQVICYNIGSI